MVNSKLFASVQKDIPDYKKVFAVTWPAFVELFLSSLFSVVDTMMVGKLGPVAISGVGLTTQPFNLLVSIFAAINVGTTTLVSWNIGAGNKEKASYITRQAIMFNIVLGTILCAAGIAASRTIMVFMGGTGAAEAVGTATEYMKILCVGIPFLAVNMSITASLRGCGYTRIPMLYNLVSNFLNVIMNYGLIYGNLGMPRLEVPGAAIATTASRIMCTVFALTILLRKQGQSKHSGRASFAGHISSVFDSPIHISLKDSWKPDFSAIKQMFSIGMPAAGEQLVIQSGLVIFAKIVSGLGVIAYAAHLIGTNVNSMLFSISQAFGVATTSLVGRSVGANDYPAAEKFTSITKRTARIITAVAGIILIILSRPIASLYTDVPEVMDMVLPVFIFMAMIHFFQSVQMSTSGALRGSGDTMYPLYACIFGIWIFRVSVGFLFVNVFGWGLVGAWFAFFLDQCTRTAVVVYRYRTGKWKEMKKKKELKNEKKM